MTDKITLGERMKGYEFTSQTHLLNRTPVIIRVDGRAFHTFTRNLDDPSLEDTPFSVKLHSVMTATALALLTEVQTSVFVYTQSDEISILLKDWTTLETQPWFGNNLQKIVSLTASIATAAFNSEYQKTFGSSNKLAHFDSRAFNLPKEEVTNYFIWRQQDAIRNSVQMYGRHFFSAKQMHGKSNIVVISMLSEKNHHWESLPKWMRRGTAVFDKTIDDNPPNFVQDREYIEKHFAVQGEENDR